MRTQFVSFQTFSFNRILTIILIAVMLLAAAPVISASADSVGFYSPTVASSNGPGWTNPIYALNSDNLYATARKNNRQLKLNSFYIPAIPGGAVINGIEVTVEGFTTGIQLEVALSAGSSFTSAKTTSFTSSESTLTLGGPNDTWGKNNWTATDFQNKFTVKLTTAATGGAVSIDAMQVKVYYTPPNTTLSLQPVSGDYGGTTTMTATLKATATNEALPGKTVTFSLNGTTVGSTTTNSSGVATINNVNLAGIIAGDYPYGAGASFAGDGFYQATSTTADLRVYGLLTTLTVSSASGEYRGSTGNITATLKETVSGSAISGKTISFTLNEVALGSVITDAAGAASVPGISLTGYDAGTYAGAIEAKFAGELNVEPAVANGTLTVTPLAVTVTGGITPANKTYDGTTNAALIIGSPTLSGVVAPDVVTLDTSAAIGTFSDKNVGTGKTVTISGLTLTGADAGNYLLTQPTGTADIAVRDLTVTAAGVNRAYDSTTAATVTLSSDAVNTDAVTLNYTSASFADQNVGTGKPVAVSGISIGGADAGNYNLLNTSANTTADITPFVVTVNAHAKTKFVGLPDPALTYSATPALFSGDIFTGALTRAPGEAVGHYPIQQGTLSAGSNYTISFVSADLTIVAKTLTTLKSVGARDGWVLETSESSTKGGTVNPTAATFLLGDSAAKQQFRSILSFSTAALPDNAVITRVILKIRKQGLAGTNPFTTHGKIAIDIRKGAFSNAAALQPADFQAAANKPGVGLFVNSPQPGSWYVARLASTAYPYINRAGITQFRLRFQKDDDNDAIADLLRFYSGNAGAANRPVLVIEYYVP